MARSLLSLNGGQAAPAEPEVGKPSSAQIRKSVHPDGVVSFIDGKTYKSMKRHLSRHGFEPATYIAAKELSMSAPEAFLSQSDAWL